MGFARVLSRGQAGLDAPLVAVEVHLGSGLPTFSIVGLPAAAVKESRERVRAALATCGFELPAGRITVNLAPADLPKEGGRYDLPVAIGILLASGQVDAGFDPVRTEFYGELALTGELKPVPGLLLAALHARRAGNAMVVPSFNVAEVRPAGTRVMALASLAELAEGGQGLLHFNDQADGNPGIAGCAASSGGASPLGCHCGRSRGGVAEEAPDLADVRGQHQAKRALLIAAAGGHSLLMTGPPGSGKTMLAHRLPGLLPPLNEAQALEVAAIAAVAQGAQSTGANAGVHAGTRPAVPCAMPPFRAPHHTASAHAIVGGGTAVRPGEVSLAHHGVLFLDELPEFDRRVLESLREPLECGHISVVRANQRAEYPASFLLVAAMNPCPCGRHGLVAPPCTCIPEQVRRYNSRISGPLRDRIDLQLRLGQVAAEELVGAHVHDGAASARREGSCGAPGVPATTREARDLVCRARQRQLVRQGCLNARLPAAATLRHCMPEPKAAGLLRDAANRHGLSARSQHRVLRVARTIADLEDRDAITLVDVAESLALRVQD